MPPSAEYTGPVAFVDGVHYPLVEAAEGEPDENGVKPTEADLSRPLRWVEGGTYRDAEDGEPLHNDVHHLNEVVVDPGSGS